MLDRTDHFCLINILIYNKFSPQDSMIHDLLIDILIKTFKVKNCYALHKNNTQP